MALTDNTFVALQRISNLSGSPYAPGDEIPGSDFTNDAHARRYVANNLVYILTSSDDSAASTLGGPDPTPILDTDGITVLGYVGQTEDGSAIAVWVGDDPTPPTLLETEGTFLLLSADVANVVHRNAQRTNIVSLTETSLTVGNTAADNSKATEVGLSDSGIITLYAYDEVGGTTEVFVEVSGDGGAKVTGGPVEVVDAAMGVIFKAPNASRWRQTISNTGVPVYTEVI